MGIQDGTLTLASGRKLNLCPHIKQLNVPHAKGEAVISSMYWEKSLVNDRLLRFRVVQWDFGAALRARARGSIVVMTGASCNEMSVINRGNYLSISIEKSYRANVE